MKLYLSVAAVTAVLILWGIGTTEDPNPDREYCEMVELYKQTEGVLGWPAYQGECLIKSPKDNKDDENEQDSK